MSGWMDAYVPVAERLDMARAEIASITTTRIAMLTDTAGVVTCKVAMLSGQAAEGTASFELGQLARLQAAHEAEPDARKREALTRAMKRPDVLRPIETAETSAVGRALAMLGFESTRQPTNGHRR